MTTIELSIPINRIGVLIGSKGTMKKKLEQMLDINLEIDSKTGEVRVQSEDNNPLQILTAKDLILAIGKGFSPYKAFQLMDEEKIFEIINLREIFGKHESKIQRIKGRIIGKEGKVRKTIEEVTGIDISVYGNSIALIGSFNQISIAREALRMIIDGKQHNTVYKFLRIHKHEIKKKSRIELWQKPSEVGS